ncbi:hypothetical protein A0H81_10496 [Grifola frondosa]|uniref:Uncharacterized protein n=1 Tax=Grifola frondosa TaxID=5627 RepID=A0A1C7LXZ2_GRIFR|nr:hypothetical protein A0H81_10496 [Grifola frondosa]
MRQYISRPDAPPLGMIYFLALLIIGIIDIILTYLGDTFNDASYISTFFNPISAIIISRFMLNLREISAPVNSSEDTTWVSSTGSVRLSTFIDPLGAPLDHGFSFSAMDPNYFDDEGADEAVEGENPLRCEEEIMSGQANVRGLPEAESGPSV